MNLKIIINKLKVSREIEFEKDIKILFELKKYNDSILNNNIKENTKQEGLIEFENNLKYVEKIFVYLNNKIKEGHYYYRNVINAYKNIQEYNRKLNYKPSTKYENKIIFFYMYLTRKYCEKEFYLSLHNNFFRSLCYCYLDEVLFKQFLVQDWYYLHGYLKCLSYILIKNYKNNYLIKYCNRYIQCFYEKLENIAEHINNYINENNFIPNNTLLKYLYFLIEFLGKNNNYNYLNTLVGVYPYLLVYSIIYNIISRVYNKSVLSCVINEGKYKCNNVKEDKDLNNINNEKVLIKYYNYINNYNSIDFMDLNEFTLYYIAKEKLLEFANLTLTNLMKDFNIMKFGIILQKQFFMDIFVENNLENYKNTKNYKILKKNLLNNILSQSKCYEIYFDVEHANKINIINKENLYNLNGNINTNITLCNKEYNYILDEITKQHYWHYRWNIDDTYFKTFYENTNEDIEKEKEIFLSMFNNNYIESNNYLKCIDEFYYIGIDFDKTITTYDSYNFLNKLLFLYYNYDNKQNIELTEEDFSFFDNISIDLIINKNINFSNQEKGMYLNKIISWHSLKEKELLNELQNKNDVSDINCEYYHTFLNNVNKLYEKYILLEVYYGFFDDINSNEVNELMEKKIDELQINDYFLDVFFNFLKYKKENNSEFYFDIITLNRKKELLELLIQNKINKLKYIGEKINCSSNVNDNIYLDMKKNFNIYYCKIHSYNVEQMKCKRDIGTYEIEINPKNYLKEETIKSIKYFSLYDKKDIQKTVCSIINNKEKLTCFIGDSLYDIHVLLNVDIPILIGKNQMLEIFCEKHDIVIKPLIFASSKIEYLKLQKKINENKCLNLKNIKDNRNQIFNDIYDENKKIFYSTESWLEIAIFFFGNDF